MRELFSQQYSHDLNSPPRKIFISIPRKSRASAPSSFSVWQFAGAVLCEIVVNLRGGCGRCGGLAAQAAQELFLQLDLVVGPTVSSPGLLGKLESFSAAPPLSFSFNHFLPNSSNLCGTGPGGQVSQQINEFLIPVRSGPAPPLCRAAHLRQATDNHRHLLTPHRRHRHPAARDPALRSFTVCILKIGNLQYRKTTILCRLNFICVQIVFLA